MEPHLQTNVPLAPYTSFKVGGNAKFFITVDNGQELQKVLELNTISPVSLLGFGSNTLISDEGLEGLTVCIRGGRLKVEDTSIVADSGVWWDDIVAAAVAHRLWGIECMSYIPGSFGASLFINITAYGQALGPVVEWVEVWDRKNKELKKISGEDLQWGYKSSFFQQKEAENLVIIRAKIQLSETNNTELAYQKALDVAEELRLNPEDLVDRRKIIHEARARADSLWHPDQDNAARTAGSFFRNPLVDTQIAEALMQYDESGKTTEQLKKMNAVHGGDERRVSAAHVMLASGFQRGQVFGRVKLNNKNLLKLETQDGATAQEVYEVMKFIQDTCQFKTGILLEPEVQLLGSFNS